MAQLAIEVNGKPYIVGCEDGQENHLRALARLFDEQVKQIASDVGALGETRLFLMGALMLADELADLKTRFAHIQADHARLQAEQGRADVKAIAALETAAKRIEALAAIDAPS